MLLALALATKFLLYVNALIAIGLILHWSLGIIEEEKAPKRLIALMVLFFALAVATKLLLANGQLAGGLQNSFSEKTFKWIWRPHALQVKVFAGALILMIVSVIISNRWIAFLGAIILSAGFGFAGHIQGLDAPSFWPVAVSVHVLIAGFWIVAPLTLFPRETKSAFVLERQVRQFSRTATWLVPFVFITGGLVLWQLVGGIAGIISTPYGWLLSSKLAAALALLAIGAYNKLKVTDLLGVDFPEGKRQLRNTLAAETVLFLVVLVLISLATTTVGPSHS